MTRHVVTHDDWENCIEHVRKSVHDNPKTQPSTGIFGPHSETWRSAGDWIGFLASAKIFMMQESHPVVGKSLNDHTNVEEDPTGRWKRSFDFVNSIRSFLTKAQILLHFMILPPLGFVEDFHSSLVPDILALKLDIRV